MPEDLEDREGSVSSFALCCPTSVSSVCVSSAATATTICGKADNGPSASNSLTIAGTPATGNKCFGTSAVVNGKSLVPLEDARITAQALGCVLKKGGVMVMIYFL
jgi:hypothetical protein